MSDRMGILGGTFNPVHIGHLIMAQDALEQLELNRVVLIPCACPPHKDGRDLAPAGDRLAMVEAAMEGDPRLCASALEIKRAGPSWTVDTLRALRAEAPAADLVFIIGADTVSELRTWRNIDEIFGLCRFAVVGRPGCTPCDGAADLGLTEFQAEQLRAAWIPGHAVGVSSREIRMRIAEGLSIRYLVPDSVEMYIAEHRLYVE